MKNVKRILAVAICLALVITCFAGCHKKDETAVTIGEYTFTAGYYACALMYADTEARQKVDKQFTDKGKSTDDIDYFKQKIDGTEYEKWVKDKAIENLKINAGYKALCKEIGAEPDETDISTATTYAENYWKYYGYEAIFSENGVSKETFIKYTVDTYYSEIYFDKVFGKEGSEPVSDEQLKKALSENYALVYRIQTDTSELSEEEIAAQKEEYEMLLEQYKAGVSFEEIYVSVHGEEDDEDNGEGVSINSNEDVDKLNNGELTAPKDTRAVLIGSIETSKYSDIYDEVAKMEIGEAKVVTSESSVAFVVRLDELSDEYYITSNDESLRKLCSSEESNDRAKKKADEIGVKEYADATDLFKVKKIKYPSSYTIG